MQAIMLCMDRVSAGTTDIHFHLLPGVDDGPATTDESLELARLALRDGTGTVVATPHIRSEFLSDPHEVIERVDALRDALRAEGIPLRVVPGGELDVDMVPLLGDGELDCIAVGPPGGRWILLESPFDGLARLQPAAAELRARGYGVVLAHPERAAGVLAGGCRILREELAHGALVQVSASSLLGGHDHESEVSARYLIDSRLVHVLASDAHSARRPPALRAGMDRLLANGQTFARALRLVELNPRTLLRDGIARRFAVAA
jgi:protein-tyrosine phosphatase